MNEYLETGRTTGLQELMERCGGITRVACIDNKADAMKKDDQVIRIIEMVEEIKRSNENTCFTNLAFELANVIAHSERPTQITREIVSIVRKAGIIRLSNLQRKWLGRSEIQGSAATSPGERNEARRTLRSKRNVDISSVFPMLIFALTMTFHLGAWVLHCLLMLIKEPQIMTH